MPEVPHIRPGPDTFRILLTTDNHVGYLENDPIRGDDSWKTFSEILHLAVKKDVDMIVQGGDLFHINKPSKKSYYHVIRTLRECCWNSKPKEFRLVSDPSNAMATKHFDYPCEYDSNINVGIPMYAISGNHDDATGEDLLSPLDLLSVGGLLNHFGRVTDNDSVQITPLLFNKGSTNLALYGLQNIREERLKRTMASGNLEFLQPDTEDDTEWFNLMCIHQNHVPRPGVRIVEEIHLPSFLDFILWGHEHECFTKAKYNTSTGFSVLQAGSSIATSLSEGEIADKHVFVLSVKGKDFSLEPIRLKSTRPFAMKDIVLRDTHISASSGNKDMVVDLLIDEVETLIEKAVESWKIANSDLLEEITDIDIPLPVIRLRVEYSGGYEVENPRRFSNRFVGKVANVNDIVTFHTRRVVGNQLAIELDKKNKRDSRKEEGNYDDKDEGKEIALKVSEGRLGVEDFLDKHLKEDDLILLKKKTILGVIEDSMVKEDKNMIKLFIEKELTKDMDLLMKLQLSTGVEGDDEIIGSSTNKDGQSIGDVKKGFKKLVKELRAKTKHDSKTLESDAMVLAKQQNSQMFGQKSIIPDSGSDNDENMEIITRKEVKNTTDGKATTASVNKSRKATSSKTNSKGLDSVEIYSDSEGEYIPDKDDESILIEDEDENEDIIENEVRQPRNNRKTAPGKVTKSKSTPTPRKRGVKHESRPEAGVSQLPMSMFSGIGRRKK